MSIDLTTTSRGFAIGYFTDHYGKVCSIQKSSLVEPDCIWLGTGMDRMHLSQEQVSALIPLLERFRDTGELYPAMN